MVKHKPFIHLFRTIDGYHMYDVNKNVILNLSKNIYNYLNDLSKGKNNNKVECYELERDEYDWLEQVQKDGFLQPSHINEIIHPANDQLEDYFENKLYMMTLQVTQQCNLRCDYCVYSGAYSHRTHSAKRMSFETAKKAINLLINHSRDRDSINVGFYGGEPLLEFDLIKKCVAYVKEKTDGKEVLINMTSNATLINEEIIDFLMSNDIRLMISLDGPKQIHDKNRRFAGNNCGTFDTIVEKVELIKQKYPQYLKNISFNSVIDPQNDFSCMNDFFMNYEDFCNIERGSYNSALKTQNYLNNENKVHESFWFDWEYEKFKKYLSKIDKLDEKYASVLMKDMDVTLKRTHEQLQPSSALLEKCHHSGPCIPGIQRLFVNTEGILYPCERVSESSDVMKIGNIEDGFNIDNIRKILNIGKITEDECKNCWAIRFCYQCAAFADEIDNFTKKKKLSSCNQIRNQVENNFRDYSVLKEMGCSFEDKRELVSFDI